MKHLFRDYPQAIYNTLEIANACHFSLSELRYRYPSEWLPPGLNSQEFLNDLVKKGTQWRYPKGPPEAVLKQIKHELQLVEQLNFADYFITIWDIVQFARKRKILCQGRGSAANSVICYCLGITAIDPVQMNLLFERFISAERNEPPDIDVDFEHERREEVIQYIYKKYGRHKAAMVSAVITFRRRSILRELSKVFALPLEGSLEERLKKSETSPALSQQIQKISREIKGFPRHLSIHSGGFTLSADPIIEIVPVEPARMSDRTIIQWDKYDLDILQLLKVDILALGMLSAIKKTLSYLGDKDSLASIPPADPQTYKMIQKAQTIGTFQIESRAQMNMLGRLQPRCFYDLVIQVAIVRPGPIVGQMVHPYLRRRRGLESPHTPNPILNKILGRTLGVPLFQEQIMKIAIELADFSPGEADQLRRAIGAWTSDGNIQDVGQRLSTGLLRSGLPAPYVQQIFEHIKGFAEYGFPESHAASFALIAYVSAYLKCHHPAEFTCGLLNSQPMGFYSPSTLVEEVRRQGVEVLPIDPNHSLWDCTLEGRKIRLGWRYIKGFPKKLAQRILEVRQERSFSSLHDFVQRSEVPKYLLERLALGDLFASFGATQRHSFWQILALQLQSRHLNSKEQLSFFETVSSIEHEPAPQLENLPLFDAIAQERQLFGISCKGHPLKALRQILTLPATTSFSLKQVPHNQWVTTCGLVITRQRPSTAKGVIFATLEDEFGFVDLIFRPEIVQNHEEAFYQNIFLEVKGRLQRDRESCSILVRSLRPLLLDHQK
jgi:error-prone DNA polymerase